MNIPIFNITIPVYNRFHLTQKTILNLRKLSSEITYSITVVDNGSDKKLQKRLIEFANDKIIDRLFILNKNMGISFACNLGWKSLDSPYYVKLDNDITIINPHFLKNILSLYEIFEKKSNFGPEPELFGRSPEIFRTKFGDIGICTSNLPGNALFIPKAVSDVVGYFNEDYGLYGAEDGDYGFRMNFLGLKQYYYETKKYFIHEGKKDSSEYEGFNLNKEKEHRVLFKSEDGGIGLLSLNVCLYELCIRNWNVPLRYEIKNQDDYFVEVQERSDYYKIRNALQKSKAIFDNILPNFSGRIKISELKLNDSMFNELRNIWKECD